MQEHEILRLIIRGIVGYVTAFAAQFREDAARVAEDLRLAAPGTKDVTKRDGLIADRVSVRVSGYKLVNSWHLEEWLMVLWLMVKGQ